MKKKRLCGKELILWRLWNSWLVQVCFIKNSALKKNKNAFFGFFSRVMDIYLNIVKSVIKMIRLSEIRIILEMLAQVLRSGISYFRINYFHLK